MFIRQVLKKVVHLGCDVLHPRLIGWTMEQTDRRGIPFERHASKRIDQGIDLQALFVTFR